MYAHLFETSAPPSKREFALRLLYAQVPTMLLLIIQVGDEQFTADQQSCGCLYTLYSNWKATAPS